MTVAIIQYNTGNTCSVQFAPERQLPTTKRIL